MNSISSPSAKKDEKEEEAAEQGSFEHAWDNFKAANIKPNSVLIKVLSLKRIRDNNTKRMSNTRYVNAKEHEQYLLKALRKENVEAPKGINVYNLIKSFHEVYGWVKVTGSDTDEVDGAVTILDISNIESAIKVIELVHQAKVNQFEEAEAKCREESQQDEPEQDEDDQDDQVEQEEFEEHEQAQFFGASEAEVSSLYVRGSEFYTKFNEMFRMLLHIYKNHTKEIPVIRRRVNALSREHSYSESH